MNAQRRATLDSIASQLSELTDSLEEIQQAEAEAFDNVPESLQGTERNTEMEIAANEMEEAVSSLREIQATLVDLVDSSVN